MTRKWTRWRTVIAMNEKRQKRGTGIQEKRQKKEGAEDVGHDANVHDKHG